MAIDQTVQRRPKTLGEGAVCFASAVGLMMAAAVILKWVMGLIF